MSSNISSPRLLNNQVVQESVKTPSMLDNPVVKERLNSFCKDYCPGVTTDQMHQNIREGEILELQLMEKNPDQVKAFVATMPSESRHQAVKNLMWLLTAKTAVTDELYTSGAMRLADPKGAVAAFIEQAGGKAVYPRISTHMKENLLKGKVQKGIDLRDGLPAGHRTLLFASQPDGTLYLKMEERGCPPFWTKSFRNFDNLSEYVAHAGHFIKTRFVKGGIGIKKARKEHVPKETKKAFAKLLKSIQHNAVPGEKTVKEEIKEGKTYGLTRMDAILESREKDIKAAIQFGDRGALGDQDRINLFRELHLNGAMREATLKGYIGDIKGREVVLPPLGSNILAPNQPPANPSPPPNQSPAGSS